MFGASQESNQHLTVFPKNIRFSQLGTLMLYEVTSVKQYKDEPMRRWFVDNYFDLIVWFRNGGIVGFQLCYDKTDNQHALTWYDGTGYLHNRIDDGENKPGKFKSVPILVPDGRFSNNAVAEIFIKESAELEPDISAFVYQKIIQYSWN